MNKVRIRRQPVPANLRGRGPSHGWFLYYPGDDNTPAAATPDYEEALAYAYHMWGQLNRAFIHYSDARH
jgi:hypothetical protein